MKPNEKMEKHTETCSANNPDSMGRCSCVYFNANHPLTESSNSTFQVPSDLFMPNENREGEAKKTHWDGYELFADEDIKAGDEIKIEDSMYMKSVRYGDLQDSLIRTFESFGWNCTDWEVWSGIHSFFAERLWRNLGKEELEKEGKLKKYATKYKHLFGQIYWREADKT